MSIDYVLIRFSVALRFEMIKGIRNSWMYLLKSVIYKRLIHSIICSRQLLIYKARGVAVGVAWAMTPLVGVQMSLVIMTWGIAKFFKWRFSLPLALAWTWVTNVVTLAPIYYLFYVTGQVMHGHFGDILGYYSLQKLIEIVFLGNAPFRQQVDAFFYLFIQDWGISMFTGCLPWAIISAFIAYRLTIRFERRRLKRKNWKKENGNSIRIK